MASRHHRGSSRCGRAAFCGGPLLELRSLHAAISARLDDGGGHSQQQLRSAHHRLAPPAGWTPGPAACTGAQRISTNSFPSSPWLESGNPSLSSSAARPQRGATTSQPSTSVDRVPNFQGMQIANPSLYVVGCRYLMQLTRINIDYVTYRNQGFGHLV